MQENNWTAFRIRTPLLVLAASLLLTGCKTGYGTWFPSAESTTGTVGEPKEVLYPRRYLEDLSPNERRYEEMRLNQQGKGKK